MRQVRTVPDPYNPDMSGRRRAWLYGTVAAVALLGNFLSSVLTSLEISVSMWILTLAFLVFAVIRRMGRVPAGRWILAGLLIEQTISVVQDTILRQGWPASQLGIFWTVKHWAFVPAAGCLAIGAVTAIRTASADREAAGRAG